MDLLRPRHVRSLVEAPRGPSISLFVPTHRAGPDTRQDPIRFKNVLGEGEEQLLERGVRRREAEEILAPARELVDDGDFWQHQGDGLAVFLSAEHRSLFRLPVAFEERVIANDRFHVKPLLRLLTGDGRFLVLALSKNEVRLLQGTRQLVREVELEDVPKSVEEIAVHRDERQVQWHAGTRGPRAAVFHGQGFGDDDELFRKFFREIEDGVREALPDERAPLVLAGVERLLTLYREASRWPSLVDEGVTGNPDELRAEELHARAWRTVEPRFRKELEARAARYAQLAGTGRTVASPEEAVITAHDGRIDTLWTAAGVVRWGRFDPIERRVEIRDGPSRDDQDLLDLASVQTLIHGGTVYAVGAGEVPGGGEVAAILRY